MEQHTPTPTEDPRPAPTRRLGVIAGAGIIAGLIAVVIGGVASAQSSGMTVVAQVDDDPVVVETEVDEDAIWDAFDQCLTDAGLDLNALEKAEEKRELTEADEEAIDAAFESCEPILDPLGDKMDKEFDELSAEDEAVFDAFDQCLIDAGIDVDAMWEAERAGDESTLDEEAIDAAFESCEPILEELSDEASWFDDEFEGCDEDHEADDDEEADDDHEADDDEEADADE